MLGDEIILESAVSDLAKKLPSLDKHDYDTIDTLMRKIASKHHITGKALHDLFIKKFDRTPDEWIKDKLDEDGEDQNWRDDPMQWHGSQNDEYEDWYEEQKDRPLRVKVHNVSEMGLQPTGVYTVRNFKKISTTNAEMSVLHHGALVTGIVNLSHPDTHRSNRGRIPNMEFYTDSKPITARQAFNIFQTKLHNDIKKTRKDRPKIEWERLDEDGYELDLQSEVDKFVDWSVKRLHIKSKPVVELSMDTEEAQNNHHTGGHVDGEDSIWVYAKNRNLVDILRTVFHELVHVRQGELDMIRPGSSYPGSPIEAMADMLAGKYIKIFGEKNHHIFQ